MPILESLSSIGKIISTTWANGSRFLWSVALAGVAAAAVLRVGAYYAVPQAQVWWDDYGLLLALGSAVVAVFAAFKMSAERPETELVLIADEQQSFWHHAKQPDGSMLTQFSLRFHVTNRGNVGLILPKVRMLRPWIRRRRVLSAMLATEDPRSGTFGTHHGIPSRSRRGCHAHLMIIGTVGGKGRRKPMQVKIEVQDNIGRRHKLVFVDLRDPQFSR
jgi:hypothetical protein